MAFGAYPKTPSDLFCLRCGHINPADGNGHCSAYGYNSVDCSPQPCICRLHLLDSKPDDFTRCGFREKEQPEERYL